MKNFGDKRGSSGSMNKWAAAAVAMLVTTACVGGSMTKPYPKNLLKDLKVEKVDATMLRFSYVPAMESALVSRGGNYESDGKVLRVVIPRCPVKDDCPVMTKAKVEKSSAGTYEYSFTVPFKGEKVVVQFDDGEMVFSDL